MSINFSHCEIFRADIGEFLKTISKKETLPNDIVALYYPAVKPDKPELYHPGETLKINDGRIYWFLNHPFEINPKISDLHTSDGYHAELNVKLKFQLNAKDAETLEDFIKVVPKGRTQIFIADIEQYFLTEIIKAVEEFTQKFSVQELVESNVNSKFDACIRSGLNRLLLNSGLEFLGSTSIIFSSQEYKTLKAQDAEIAKNADFEVQRAKLREIWDKVKRDEALSKFEFEQFLAELKNNKIIQELQHGKEQLEVKQEFDEAYLNYEKQQFDMQKTLEKLELNKKLTLDRIKFLERLEQAKIAQKKLPEATTEFFISLIEDENLRAKLYEELIMQKMTPEQIKMLKLSDIDEKIDEKLAEFYKKIVKEIEKGLEKRQA